MKTNKFLQVWRASARANAQDQAPCTLTHRRIEDLKSQSGD